MIYGSYTIRFILHRRSDTPRKRIHMRVTPRGHNPVSFATGLSLLESEWDPYLDRAKGRSPESAEVNTLIARWSQLVADLFAHYDALNVVPSSEQLHKDFARVSSADNTVSDYVPQQKNKLTVLAAFTQFILSGRYEGSWSEGTVYAMNAFRSALTGFFPETPLEMVDTAWMERFHQWLVQERNQQGVSVNGNLNKMRWFLRWARRKGLYSGNADIEYRPKVKGASLRTRSIMYLSRDELRILEEAELPGRHLSVARDVFLFGCYTGLRFSDIFKLTQADIFSDHITFTTQKTNHTLTVPLNDKAKAVLDRYSHCQPNRLQRTLGIVNPAIPTPYHKAMNKHLHAIFKLIGIDTPTRHIYYIGNTRHEDIVPKYKLVTTHTARHTFIVTAISLGIPIPVIMEWTGHSNYNAMRPYISVANETSMQAMQKFNTI